MKIQKIMLFTVLACGIMAHTNAQNTLWNIDKVHSKVGFSVAHMMVAETEGTFDQYEAKLWADADDFSDIKIDFKIDVASINTRNERRDKHLRDPDFFDAVNHPKITFNSNSVEKKEDGKILINGDLTIRGTTKPVTFEGEYKGTIAKDAFGLTRAGLNITATINRQEYGVAYNGNLEAGGLMLGNKVDIMCKLSLTKDKNK